jgi:L-lysine exporter family protein LysE/ArgO
MLTAGVEGFLLGAGLIVAIGAQNAFVLRQGLRREHVLAVCLVCALADALLIAIGVAGIGTSIGQSRSMLGVVTLGGALFLIGYGLWAFARALRPQAMSAQGEAAATLSRAVALSLAFTFLNPHVYLDTVLLLGGLSARHAGGSRLAYAGGAALASFAWFFALGYGARLLTPFFSRPSAWRALDIAIGVVMWSLAAGLVMSLLD